MAKRFQHIAELSHDVKVPYSAVARKDRGKWVAVFHDRNGKRVRSLTTQDVRGKSLPSAFHDEAKDIIRKEYLPATVKLRERKTWAELLAEAKKTSPNTRDMTLSSFDRAVRAFTEVMPAITSPADVTQHDVEKFKRLWLAGANKKFKGQKRSPVTLSYYLRALSSLTNHLVDLGYVKANHFKGVKVPKADKKKPRVPNEEETTAFFMWLLARYPDWNSLHALIELKAISACRTADLCQLKTAQLSKGYLTFSADITKTREERSLPLPEKLFTALQKTAGEIWLWENLYQECRQKRKGRGRSAMGDSFKWESVYAVLNNIFREYNDERPGQPRFKPHDLRRRAITLTVKATGSVDQAATAIGVHAATAKKHYLDAKQAFETDETMRRVAELLMPKVQSQAEK